MSKKRVLVIEDSPYLADSLRDMLEIRGHEPLIAPNGRTGIEIALEKKPDLILLDIRLPDISGYEVFRTLRRDDWGKDAKITILTASESTDTIAKNIAIPAKEVLFKPEWSVSDLLNHIDERLTQ